MRASSMPSSPSSRTTRCLSTSATFRSRRSAPTPPCPSTTARCFTRPASSTRPSSRASSLPGPLPSSIFCSLSPSGTGALLRSRMSRHPELHTRTPHPRPPQQLFSECREDIWVVLGLSGYLAGLAIQNMFGNNEYTFWLHQVVLWNDPYSSPGPRSLPFHRRRFLENRRWNLSPRRRGTRCR